MTSPSADTASAAPGSRGALRYVRTTVARPTVSPASHHFVTLLRMSRMPPPSLLALSPEPDAAPRVFPACCGSSRPRGGGGEGGRGREKGAAGQQGGRGGGREMGAAG